MPALMRDYYAALRLCVNLESFSWSDDNADGSKNDENILAFLDILLTLPIKELTVHTYNGLGDEVWNKLQEMSGLRKAAIWCMEGQPRILQGWSEALGPTLTHLELGVSHSRIESPLPCLIILRSPAAMHRRAFQHPRLRTFAPHAAESAAAQRRRGQRDPRDSFAAPGAGCAGHRVPERLLALCGRAGGVSARADGADELGRRGGPAAAVDVDPGAAPAGARVARGVHAAHVLLAGRRDDPAALPAGPRGGAGADAHGVHRGHRRAADARRHRVPLHALPRARVARVRDHLPAPGEHAAPVPPRARR